MLAQGLCESSPHDVTLLLALIYNARCAITETSNQANANLMYAKLCLEKHEELYKRDRRPTAYLATAYNDLGQAYARNEIYSKASDFLMKSKAVRESLPGFIEFNNWSPVYHLGVIAWVQGNNDRASSLLLGALKVREERLGKNDTQ